METPNPIDPDPIPHEIPVFPPDTPQPEPIDDPIPDVPAISLSFR